MLYGQICNSISALLGEIGLYSDKEKKTDYFKSLDQKLMCKPMTLLQALLAGQRNDHEIAALL